MPLSNDLAQVTRSLATPLGELIVAVGRGVAEAQQALDLHTLDTFKAVYSSDEATYAEFRQLGYQPTWYKIPEVNAEIFVSPSASGQERLQLGDGVPRGSQPPGRIQLYATPVDAGYSNTFDYNLRACSQVKFRIVPVPPAAQAEGLKVMPNLDGKTYNEAVAILDQFGIPYELAPDTQLQGNETIKETQPKAGAILSAGQVATLTLKSQ